MLILVEQKFDPFTYINFFSDVSLWFFLKIRFDLRQFDTYFGRLISTQNCALMEEKGEKRQLVLQENDTGDILVCFCLNTFTRITVKFLS